MGIITGCEFVAIIDWLLDGKLHDCYEGSEAKISDILDDIQVLLKQSKR